MTVKTFPKANFIQLVSYWQEHTDFEQLEKDKMLETYFAGMKYFEQIAGKAGKVELFPEDIELLLMLKGDRHTTIEELAEMSSFNKMALNKKIYKFIVRGFVSSYKEKRQKYYRLTPYGEKMLIEEILNN